MNINEIEPHLKSLWKPRVSKKTGKVTFKRSVDLIVPGRPGWDEKTGRGDLNNGHWAYDVSYAFRSALDISYDTRRKTVDVVDKITGEAVIDEETGKPKRKKVVYQVWTQGLFIHFKEGDLLSSSKGFPALQVKSSSPMEWDEENNVMFEGEVNYEIFEKVKFGHVGDVTTVSQMDFLSILVCGK